VTLYRDRFEPSEQLAEPYVIAGVNAIAADTSEEAHRQFESSLRRRVVQMVGRGQKFTPEEVDLIMTSPAGQQITQMVRYSAVGTPTEVKAYLDEFAEHAQADELIVASMAEDTESWLKSYDLLADAWRPAPVRG
jgi:alkanesulfonate monooxygenase SsuD/methylene tetrahydromethanopterin reductase-like flavin-dependent oxidoreductase (luciferase family)